MRNGSLELFDSESGPDLTLSPQTFTSTAEAFINDNSDSLGVPGDNDTGSPENRLDKLSAIRLDPFDLYVPFEHSPFYRFACSISVSLFFSTLHYSPISRWARPKSKVESGEEWLAGFIEAGLR
ncbi:zinc finger protein 541-like [Vespula maculifrons]|uniref:Zinc finger protein 541-like n=1 Tax=Vespula maculifrons TaxID=7453 RepID=A0ABD2CWF3_VESMC